MNKPLAELERRLQDLPREAPSAGLRGRVLSAVTDELIRPPKSNWSWPAIAAGVLILLNLSAIWSSQSQFRPGPATEHGQSIREIHLLRAAEAQLEGVFR